MHGLTHRVVDIAICADQAHHSLHADHANAAHDAIDPLTWPFRSSPRSVLLTAFLGTAAIFLCFSGAALLARRRSYLFLGGMLSSVLAVFATMRLVTWFTGGGAALFEAELYLGLLVFLGYVLYDTQLAVEKAEAGDRDTVRAAQDLFIDFMAVFVRLLVILLRNAGKRDEEEGRDRRRSRGGRRRTEL